MSTTLQAESRFFTANGLRLHYLDWGNYGAPHMVYVHGLRGTAHAFDGTARRFRDRYHIMAVDVRGRGESAWSPEGKYDYQDYVADLESVVDQPGLEHFTLVGTSMGGIISMAYAGAHPERLERLILNDIGPDPEPGSDRITQAVAATPDAFSTLEEALSFRRSTMPALARLTEAEQREQALFVVQQEPDGRWVWKMDPAIGRQRAAGGSPSRPALWPVLQRLQCPTLVVWGMESDVLSEAQGRRMVDVLPHGELAAIPGVGHAPTLTEPEAIAALERFLGSG